VALDGAGNGLVYRGSFTYRKTGSNLALESVPFSAGRFVADAWGHGVANYYITDHLGSVRLVVDCNGEVLERNNYYPFGKRWEDGNQITDNRYRFNGKEEQEFVNAPYSDYGARQYNSDLIRWNGVDPLAEIAPGINPFAFSNNNPIRFIDRDGRQSTCFDEANEEARYNTDTITVNTIEPVVIWGKRPQNHSMAKANAYLVDTFIPGKAFADDANAAAARGAYGIWAGNMVAGMLDIWTLGTGTKLKAGLKIGTTVVKATARTTVTFSKFTSANFRSNLAKLTGAIPAGAQAHHILPQKFAQRFKNLGLNIHDPRFGAWLESGLHLRKSHTYNMAWDEFFLHNPNPTSDAVIREAEKLMQTIFKQ